MPTSYEQSQRKHLNRLHSQVLVVGLEACMNERGNQESRPPGGDLSSEVKRSVTVAQQCWETVTKLLDQKGGEVSELSVLVGGLCDVLLDVTAAAIAEPIRNSDLRMAAVQAERLRRRCSRFDREFGTSSEEVHAAGEFSAERLELLDDLSSSLCE